MSNHTTFIIVGAPIGQNRFDLRGECPLLRKGDAFVFNEKPYLVTDIKHHAGTFIFAEVWYRAEIFLVSQDEDDDQSHSGN